MAKHIHLCLSVPAKNKYLVIYKYKYLAKYEGKYLIIHKYKYLAKYEGNLISVQRTTPYRPGGV